MRPGDEPYRGLHAPRVLPRRTLGAGAGATGPWPYGDRHTAYATGVQVHNGRVEGGDFSLLRGGIWLGSRVGRAGACSFYGTEGQRFESSRARLRHGSGRAKSWLAHRGSAPPGGNRWERGWPLLRSARRMHTDHCATVVWSPTPNLWLYHRDASTMSRSDDLVPANQASVLRCPAGVLEAWIGTRPRGYDSRPFWLSDREFRVGWTRRRTQSLVALNGIPCVRDRRGRAVP